MNVQFLRRGGLGSLGELRRSVLAVGWEGGSFGDRRTERGIVAEQRPPSWSLQGVGGRLASLKDLLQLLGSIITEPLGLPVAARRSAVRQGRRLAGVGSLVEQPQEAE